MEFKKRFALVTMANKDIQIEGLSFQDEILVIGIDGKIAHCKSQYLPDFDFPVSGLDIQLTIEEEAARRDRMAEAVGREEEEAEKTEKMYARCGGVDE